MVELTSDYLRRAAASLPDEVAIVDGGRELRWSEVDRRTDRLARRLIAAGLAPGRSVMILGENSAEFLILCFAVWRAGGVMAVAHASFGPDELDYALGNAEPIFLFAERAYRAGAVAAVERSAAPTLIFDLTPGIESLADIQPSTGDLPLVDPDALGVIGYTSGTTGRPKPVAHSHGTIARGTDACAAIWRVTSSDVILVAMPLSWLAGLIILSVTATTRGARIHLLRRFSAHDALDAMVGQGVSFFFGATTMYVKIVNAWRQRRLVGGFRLRCCISGGEARNEAVFDEWRRITGTPVLDSYGASECWPFVTHDPGLPTLPPPGSAGKLVEGAQIRLLDPEGRVVPRGEAGEVQGLAPCMMMSYWKEPELTAKAITPDGWYRTGDYARIDADGYVHVLGRIGDLIRSDGNAVYPAEVEQVLSELEQVAQVAVVGLPDPNRGQRVAAAIVVAPGTALDEADVTAHCAARLPAFKVPDKIRIVRELPHNASGKVLRREVAPMFSQDFPAGNASASHRRE
ncbi:AMP-binding protein [Sphingomonas histidinilytica]|uniref:Long-chain acyl-CoA synthetase n=1 Tax=Rhizorhabdus histidinilytica TaxID=439228 RepID=A0A1T5FP35_9SPHN|nr:class I adenylate-forming enzyme family protein [Rhizorhabdus histidinilytica]MBO9377114.1 AMP-binding protein [Rhizorhabdus histidinilytica]SKB97915.1 long-chain acyl-CoA synthetase [Rhizorhabdus histidinilytica]